VMHLSVILFLAYFPCFENMKVGLWVNLAIPVHAGACRSVCVPALPNNFWTPEPITMKLGMYIMPPEELSMPYFITPSHQ
jgi:hypothetical protein